jgi:hypothetical protein
MCSHGGVQVTTCAAFRGGEPFPTTFWLVCPHLEGIAARLESRQGISSLEETLRSRAEAWRRYHMLHSRLRLETLPPARRGFVRARRRRLYDAVRLGGVGGIAYLGRSVSAGVAAKCIHLQIASYLALGFHPAADWLDEHVRLWECPGGVCMDFIQP